MKVEQFETPSFIEGGLPMKTPAFVVTLALFPFITAPIYAAKKPHVRRASVVTRLHHQFRVVGGISTDTIIAREKSLIARIEQRFGSYGESVVTDPRFVIDCTLYRRPPQPPHSVLPSHPRRHDYDYVFSRDALAEGPAFLEAHHDVFAYAESAFRVPKEDVDALLNIETQWGRVTGTHPVLVTLYTIAVLRPDFQYHDWALDQLMAFLKYCALTASDPFAVKGSRTGAFGLVQFEPMSYFAYAVRCQTGEGHPDLFNPADAICSAANYLQAAWGEDEASQLGALYTYNHDKVYGKAVLDYADLLAGRPSRHRYTFIHVQNMERAALK